MVFQIKRESMILKNRKPPRQLKASDVPKLRKWLLKKQKGKCLICGKEPKTPCLDHAHKKKIKGSGLVRGVICSPCNIFLAKSENNCVRYGIKIIDLPHILRRVAKYLEQEHLPYIHPSEKIKEPVLTIRNFKKLATAYIKKYPNRKPLQYVYSKPTKKRKTKQPRQKLNKKLAELYDEFGIKPEFFKSK